jgi:RND family efflux transporter MFP subunit
MPGWFKKTPRKIKVIILLLVLIAGFFIVKQLFFGKKDGLIFDTVQKRSITEVVTESGIITTDGRVRIFSPTNGIVSEVYVSNGEVVSEGQKLFAVKSTATSQEKAAAQAAFRAAQSDLQQAENNRRATQATVDKIHDDVKNHDKDESYAQRDTRTTAEVANDNAYDELLSARAALASAQAAWQFTQNAVVTAPLTGYVSNLAVIKGSGVTAYTALAPPSPVVVITVAVPPEIVIAVGEGDINKISLGQPAVVKLDAVDDREYAGIVNRFDSQGTIIQGVVKFNVYLAITDPDGQPKPGMTVDVDITTRELSDVLSVPNAAVKPYQKGRAVRRLGSKGQIEYLPVKIGVRGKEFTQILEGLTEGQEIIVALSNEKTGKKGLFAM